VDDPRALGQLLDLFHELAEELPTVFAIHPRTAEAAKRGGLANRIAPGQRRIICLGPQGYLDTISLVAGAAVVLTDSGGLQEETSVLGVPCLTLRESTERPVTVERGTSRLVGNDPERIKGAFREVLRGAWPRGEPIPLWDGRAAVRVAKELAIWLNGN
jgi:UDP-N-acetylglucosamine 2-epimerase (non-hydrolysing)